ncbi:MAG: Cas9 inhibitor AcrIIA9 family protein [Clostridium sp.]|uniref:Cas9 inhibitor AcrIIA9 family protein n=1 Tax=Clostridium sp. TaxID=1506 RepID=UPI00302211B9
MCITNAIEKINQEIKKENSEFVRVIGAFLINLIKNNEEAAKMIMNQDKTIMGSLNEMSKEAKKKAVKGCAMLSDEEGFGIVLKYYGITQEVEKEVNSSNKVISINEYKKESKELDINLDDLLDL